MIDNRDEWLKARLNGIGASEAACVIGKNPWKTNVELWQEKIGIKQAEDISDKPCVKYGKSAEEFIREIFKLDYPQYSVGYDEFDMIANIKDKPWLFATLDGYMVDRATNEFGVLEIKTTEILNPAQWSQWDRQVPEHYYCQILHQLLATGYSYAILRADIRYHKDGQLIHTIRDYRFEREQLKADLNILMIAETKFWNCVKERKRPALILPEI